MIRLKNKKIIVFGIILSILLITNIAFAQESSLQQFKDIGSSISGVFSQGKIIQFLEAWVLLMGTIWFVLNNRFGKEKGILAGKSGFIKIALIGLVFGIPTAAGMVLKSDNTIKSLWIAAWAIYFLLTTFFEKEGQKHDYGAYAVSYWITSIIGAPRFSLIAGGIEVGFFVHAFIGWLIWFGFTKREKSRESEREQKERVKEAEREQKEEARRKEEREFQEAENRKREAHELALEQERTKRAEYEAKNKLGNVADLQRLAISQPSNIAAINNELKLIEDALPKDKTVLYAFVNDNSTTIKNEEIKDNQKDLAERVAVLKLLKDDFKSTSYGIEAEYLLQVLNDLRDKSKWTSYVGERWDRCDFADKLGVWKNPDYEYWQKKFKATVSEGGIEKARKLLKERLNSIGYQRNSYIKQTMRTLERLTGKTQKESEIHEEDKQEIQIMIQKLNEHNKEVENFNKILQDLRNSIRKAGAPEIMPQQRTRIVVDRIVPGFNKLMKSLDLLKNHESELITLVEKNEQLKKDLIQKMKETSQELIATAGIVAILKGHYRLSAEEMREAA